MNQAYELKALVEKFKSKGLDIAEESAKIIIEGTLDWVQESAVLSENKVDDFVMVLIPVIKPHILSFVDKIDGQVG